MTNQFTPATPGTLLLHFMYDPEDDPPHLVLRFPVVSWANHSNDEEPYAEPVSPWDSTSMARKSDPGETIALKIDGKIYSVGDWEEFETEEAWIASCLQHHKRKSE